VTLGSMSDRGIAPGLLVASPDLRDPNFARSVVLMIQHDENSSFGLVVNRPTGLRVAEAQESLQMLWSQSSPCEVFRGGPIDPGVDEPMGFALHYPSSPLSPGPTTEEPGELRYGIVLYTIPPDPDSLARLTTEIPERVRFVVGYAQWGPGQLEMELLQGAWLVAEADPRIIFETPIDSIWEAAVRSIGIDPDALLPGSLVAGPEIH
jgi:putative transcriptional regulator